MKCTRTHRQFAGIAASLVLLLLTTSAWADPPGRVARIAYLAGEVSFAPAGEDTWYAAQLNRPLVAGDQLWTGLNGRVELEMGTATYRLDQGSHFEFLSLSDEFAQAQLSEGAVHLRIDYLHAEQTYEIATPALAFVATQVGEYRLDVDSRGVTQISLLDGSAMVYGENGSSLALYAGSSYRFHRPGQLSHERMDLPAPDDFERWAMARNQRYHDSVSSQYVSPEMIGYADLDHHGHWNHVADHGNVWFPRHVAPGWAPYRHGHWSWIEPWGWTWVDDAPWGFAPFHYGRWVYVSNGWGWVPGPRHLRPWYAPALVAFVGGSGWSLTVSSGGPPIGWFPLGPNDVYMPWYRVSRGYFGRVNVHNTYVFNNVYVTNIYNDYYVQGRAPRRDYTFRSAANAVTVVPQDTFVNARDVAGSMARLRPGVIDRGEIMTRAPAAPTRASLAASGRAAASPPERTRSRAVIARSEPSARPAPFESRQRAIARNGGEPLPSTQMRRLSASHSDAGRAVRVLGRDSSGSDRPARSNPADPGTTANRPSSRTPIAGDDAPRGRGLPSARYAPRRDGVDVVPHAAPSRAAIARPAERNRPSESTPASASRDGAGRTVPGRSADPATRTPARSARDTVQTPSSRVTPSEPSRAQRSSIPLPPNRQSSARSSAAEPPPVSARPSRSSVTAPQQRDVPAVRSAPTRSASAPASVYPSRSSAPPPSRQSAPAPRAEMPRAPVAPPPSRTSTPPVQRQETPSVSRQTPAPVVRPAPTESRSATRESRESRSR